MSGTPRLVNALFPSWVDTMQGQAAPMWLTQDQEPEDAGSYAPLISAAAALSVAGMFGITHQRIITASGTASTGSYGTVSDQVVFPVRTANTWSKIVVPAPKAAIFESDTETVNMSNSLVVAFLEQVYALLGDSSGAPWDSVQNGYRRKVRLGGGF